MALRSDFENHSVPLSPLEHSLATQKNKPTTSLVPELEEEPKTALQIPSLRTRITEKNKVLRARATERHRAALQADLQKIANRLISGISQQIQSFLAAEDPAECCVFESKFDASPNCAAATRADCPAAYILSKVNSEFSELGKIKITIHNNSEYILTIEVD